VTQLWALILTPSVAIDCELWYAWKRETARVSEIVQGYTHFRPWCHQLSLYSPIPPWTNCNPQHLQAHIQVRATSWSDEPERGYHNWSQPWRCRRDQPTGLCCTTSSG